MQRKHVATVGVPALAAAALAAGAVILRSPVDDAFIHFRYALNIAVGNGPVFNPGDRVEGFNTPLWEYLLAGMHWLGAPIIPTAHTIGILAGALTVVTTGLVAAHLAPRMAAVVGPAAALLVALHPGVLFWTASGMETSLFMLFLLLGLAAGTLGAKPVLAGSLCAFAALTRTEGLLFGMMVAVTLVARGDRRSLPPFATALLAPLVAYEIFRLAYYGALLPNVYYAKAAFQLKHGLWYVWQFLRNGGFVFVLALIALAGEHRQTAGFWLFAIAAYLAWVVSVGGDFYAFHRYIVPVVPLLAVLSAVALAQLFGSRPGWTTAAVMVGLLCWSATMADSYRYARSAVGGMRGFVRYHAMIGESLRTRSPSGTTVAAAAVGALSYFAGPGIRVIDMLGLTDAHIARDGVKVTDGLPGHCCYDIHYVLEQRPDLVFVRVGPVVAGLKRFTAEAIRNDPGAFAWCASIGIETGSYVPVDPELTKRKSPYGLPVHLGFSRPEHQERIERVYEPITAFPVPDRFRREGDPGGEFPVDALKRRGWSFPRN
jgi:hypothetical protein